MIIKDEVCSLCHKSYDGCDHIEGKPYMRKFCKRVGKLERGLHVAFVSRPYDKRARIVSINYNDIERDIMTLRMRKSK